MRIFFIATASVLLLACASPSPAPSPSPGDGTPGGDDGPAETAPFNRISVQDGRLGWNGVRVGQTLDDIERVVGEPISTRTGEAPACGDVFADPEVAGRELTVQLSPMNGGFRSDSVFVPFMFDEKNLSDEAFSQHLQQAVPALVPREGRHGPTPGPPMLFVLENNRKMAVLIKPDRGFILARWGCLD